MISEKTKQKRIQLVQNKMKEISHALKSTDFFSLSEMKGVLGGNYLLYSFLKHKNIIYLKDGKYVWKSNVKVDTSLATEYFNYQYFKYKLTPSRILRDSKFKSDKSEVKEISSQKKEEKRQFSILWGLLKFKY